MLIFLGIRSKLFCLIIGSFYWLSDDLIWNNSAANIHKLWLRRDLLKFYWNSYFWSSSTILFMIIYWKSNFFVYIEIVNEYHRKWQCQKVKFPTRNPIPWRLNRTIFLPEKRMLIKTWNWYFSLVQHRCENCISHFFAISNL